MTNTLCVLIYLPLLLMTLLLLISALATGQRQPFVRYSMYFYTMLLLWQITGCLYHLTQSAFGVRYIFDLKLVFIAFSEVMVFFMFASFYRVEKMIPAWLFRAVFIVPVLTLALAVTSPFHSLLLKQFKILSFTPLTVVWGERAEWYYVHLTQCILILFWVGVVAAIQYYRLPKYYRRGSVFMFFALAITILGIALEVFGLDGGHALDFNLIGASLSGLFYYLATLLEGRTHCLQLESREIFHYLDEGIFLLNEHGVIVDANDTAKSWLRLLGKKFECVSFEDLLKCLEDEEKITRKSSPGEEDEGIYVLGSKYPLIFSAKTHALLVPESLPPASFVVLSNVTNDRLFIDRLRGMAGEDPLTSLPNRYRYQELLRSLDTPDNLPLSIIMGDVNGLKDVNDTYGHETGDELLKAVAAVLKGCCPENGYVARFGGDEFIMLLPRCLQWKAQRIILRVQRNLQSVPNLPMRPTIALGSATKNLPEENISCLINEADLKMYGDKR